MPPPCAQEAGAQHERRSLSMQPLKRCCSQGLCLLLEPPQAVYVRGEEGALGVSLCVIVIVLVFELVWSWA